MSLQGIADAIHDSPLSVFIRESSWGFQTVECVHVVAITLVVGTITIVDLRLTGLASRKHRVTELSRDTLHWTWMAFGVAALSGLLMVYGKFEEYFTVPAFWLKFMFMGCAAINMLVFELITFKGVSRWDAEVPVPTAAKLAGGVSLFCWTVVVILGRWIGYTVDHGSVLGHGF